MITAQTVNSNLGALIDKATALQLEFAHNAPTGNASGIEGLSAHTWYGLAETVNDDVLKALAILVTAHKKIESKFA